MDSMFAVSVMTNGLLLVPTGAAYQWLVLGCWLAVFALGSRYLLSGAAPRVRRIGVALLLAVVLSAAYGVRESDARIRFYLPGWFTAWCVC
jgi:hypothetical protein